MFAQRLSVDVTTDGSGDATVYIPVDNGALHSIHYVKTDFATGVDFTITVESTGEGIWTESDVNAAVSKYPRAAVQDIVGAAALYAATFAIVEPIVLARDRIKIVVASGGALTTGQFIAIIK